jgi:hypothetical protein
MKKEDCRKTLEAMFDEFEHEHRPWRKASLAWKIVICTMFLQENRE